MIKQALVQVLRLAFITGSLVFLAPLVPGVEFAGSWLQAGALGAALLVFFGGMRFASRKLQGADGHCCPSPSTLKWVVLAFLVGTAALLMGVSWLFPAILSVSNIFAAAGASLAVLVGTVLSNFATNPLEDAPPASKKK